ncbi:protein CYCLOPS-like [Vicia villosa]|uniref:protein CYCLOPS-like n=1 Tax=Vicia villosa TaxID=3911 RepID=UPI00273BDC03|nr:protein CYCLOPS-like [Vicia villosa]
MEGRGFYSSYKNSSEELFMKTLMDNPIGVPIPTMDSFRTDSEELFKRWLTNDQGYSSSSRGLPSRLSQRVSSELSNLSNQQNMSAFSEGRIMQDNPKANDYSTVFNQFPIGEPIDEFLQSSNLFLAKAWFLTDQRMTRSRSSELRQRYSEMYNGQVAQGIESVHMLATQNGANSTQQQEISNLNGFDHLNQNGTFASLSNSSSSRFHTHQLNDNTDKVSSYVNMLKNSLEFKRHGDHIEKQEVEDNSNGIFSLQQDPFLQTSFGERNENWSHQNPIYAQENSTIQVKDHEAMQLQTLEASINLIDLDGLVNQTNPIYLSSASPSESSAAAPIVSTGLDGRDDPCISSQTLCESSWNKVGGSTSFTEHMKNNLKDDRKKRSLERYGSVTSAISEGKENATKKRRVERSRKMAEAKEKNLIPSIPPDMQVVLKRCEDLEKEIRSLKLNLSFMNRKDSEQTKLIEDLQKQNEDLADEKECLWKRLKELH